jgi:DMSO/TMAO reductase YedYZ molybdopterin-dependent catalytic subunit
MQLHVGAALVALPFAVWHVVARRVRAYRNDLSRRQLLKAGVLLGGAAAVYAGTEAVARVAGLAGSRRRFTGSHERGSRAPDEMPVTQWLDDDIPAIDADAWRLIVQGRVGVARLGYPEIVEFDDRVTATIDCTGGWFAVQRWEGVWLSRIVELDESARSFVVVSSTGYRRRLPISLLDRTLLATRIDGAPLSPGHGFPARLVVPGRRGFWWVKWVTQIEGSTLPSWAQSPFPLT